MESKRNDCDINTIITTTDEIKDTLKKNETTQSINDKEKDNNDLAFLIKKTYYKSKIPNYNDEYDENDSKDEEILFNNKFKDRICKPSKIPTFYSKDDDKIFFKHCKTNNFVVESSFRVDKTKAYKHSKINKQNTTVNQFYKDDTKWLLKSSNIKSQSNYLENLKNQIAILVENTANLEFETKECNERLRNYHDLISETKSEIYKKKKDYEHMEETIMKNVFNKEKIIDMKIQEKKIRLHHHHNELTFELQEELDNFKSFNDQEIIKKINYLEKKITNLNKELEETREKNDIELKNCSENYDKLLKEHMKTKEKKLNIIVDKFLASTNNYDQQKIILDEKNALVNKIKTEIQQYELQIQELKNKISNIDLKKNNKMIELKDIDKKLLDFNIILKNSNEEKLNLKKQYEILFSKFEELKSKIRILENSIMSFEANPRVFLRFIKSIKTLNNHELHYNNIFFSFNKIFDENTDKNTITKEFSCFVEEVLINSNISIVFVGVKDSDLVYLSILNSLETLLNKFNKLNFNFLISNLRLEFKCLAIDQSQCFDLLLNDDGIIITELNDNLSEIKAHHVSFDLINDFFIISEKIKKVYDYSNKKFDNAIILYIFHVYTFKKNKEFENTLLFLDATNRNFKIQNETLRNMINRIKLKTFSSLEIILQFVFKFSKLLFLANFDDVKVKENTTLLETLKEIHNLDSPYK